MNIHYYNRYLSFLDKIKQRGYSIGSTHKHHIIPRSMGGSNDSKNIIILSIREHFLAHWMLAKAHENGKMWLAFRIMCLRFKDCSNITSKMYEISELKRIENTIGLLKNKVWVGDKWVTSDEYQNEVNNYKHFNAGRITVRDKITGETSKQPIDYDKGKYESIKIGNVNVYDKNTNSYHEITKDEFLKNKDRYKSFNANLVHCVEIESGDLVSVSREEYKNNKNIKYRRKDAGLSLVCPHCLKEGGSSMRRWHFNNCKLKGN